MAQKKIPIDAFEFYFSLGPGRSYRAGFYLVERTPRAVHGKGGIGPVSHFTNQGLEPGGPAVTGGSARHDETQPGENVRLKFTVRRE